MLRCLPRLRASHLKVYTLVLIVLYFATLLYIRSHNPHHDASAETRGDASPATLQRYVGDGSKQVLSPSTSRRDASLGDVGGSARSGTGGQELDVNSRSQQAEIESAEVVLRHGQDAYPSELTVEEALVVKKSALPAFAADESEFVFGSVIERSFDSWDLHITTFLLCHYMLEPSTSISGMGVERTHPIMREKWRRAVRKFMEVAYYPSGRRLPTPVFYCRLANSATSAPYLVEGSFVPNRLTSDSNANRRLDLFRCKLEGSQQAYSGLAGGGDSVQVEILRGSESLFNFTVPWESRRTGFMFSHPPAATRLDMWAGSIAAGAKLHNGARQQTQQQEEQGAAPTLPNPASRSVVHVCVPGTRQLPSKKTLPLFLEFVAHHVLLGVDHIHLAVLLGWTSPHMARFVDVFRSYIRQGKLSIGSQAGDGIDMVHSLAGMTWNKNAMKIFQANACLYSTKGLADYLLIMDVDEFFVPRFTSGFRSILDVIRAVEAPEGAIVPPDSAQVLEEIKDSWAGGRGLADGDAHPSCYLKLTSHVHVNRRSGSFVDPAHPWMGDRFSHGFETTNELKVFRYSYRRPILPTAKIFQAGLNTGGACVLPAGWTSCRAGDSGAVGVAGGGGGVNSGGGQEASFCGDGSSEPRRMGRMKNGQFFDFRGDHNFDEVVTESDARTVNEDSEAYISHFLLYHETLAATPSALLNNSDYSQYFFHSVLQDLRSRNLELLVLMPDEVAKAPTVDDKWDKLFSKDDILHAATFSSIKEALHAPKGRQSPPMPQNFSMRHLDKGTKVVPLPYFSVDFSEYILGAMIERVSDSYDLYMTVFFLCHGLLEPKVGLSAVSGERVHREMLEVWKRVMRIMETTKYHDNGMREAPPHFYCRITHASSSHYKPYLVKGQWVPSRLTPDSNSNRRMDIFRCKMEDTEHAYMHLARSPDAYVTVEILRDEEPLLAFRVPWRTRTAGYMLETPTHLETSASRLDPWKGFDVGNPGHWSHDRLYMCVPGLETAPSKTTLPLYLEFVQHHLGMGVQHFFLGALFNWESKHMQLLLRVFESYVQDQTVSWSSSAGDGFDLVYSTAGLQWGRDNVKNFQVNMCTYFSKGMADYVGIWDFDEHFIPVGNNSNILDLIDSIESPVPIPYFHGSKLNTDVYPHWGVGGAKMGRGLADRDGHPLCYIILNAVVTLFAQAHTAVDPQHPWLGERFAHGSERNGHGLGFKKSIRPTRTIFQGGLHLAGSCRLPKPWNGCKKDVDFCYNEGPSLGQVFRLTKFPNGTAINFNINHRFDEITLEQDAYTVNADTQAYVNHLQYHRFWFGASAESLQVKSPYTSLYFPSVYRGLDNRDLVLPISLPELQQKPFPLPDHDWHDLIALHKDISAAAAMAGSDGSASSKFAISGSTADGGSEPVLPTFSTKLPHFAHDRSELFLASVIERESDSFNLFLTTFLLSHPMIEPKEDGTQALRVRNSSLADWTTAIVKFKQALYLPNGKRRRSPKYFCKLSNAEGEAPYLVEGDFVPNRLTPDIGANRRLDTFRCRMHNTREAYLKLARSSASVQVEIFRESQSLISFTVSWGTRTNGKMLDHAPVGANPPGLGPASASTITAVTSASKLDPWAGFDPLSPGKWKRDVIHLCVPGIESPPSRKNLPIYLEFLQHHINMGATHIHLTALFTWKSIHMARLLRVLKSYIDDGLVSVTSHATDGADYLYSVEGLSWMRDNIKINQVNMCVYLAKGVADYVGIWDVDEFFIPKGRFGNLLQVIQSTEGGGRSGAAAGAAGGSTRVSKGSAEYNATNARLKAQSDAFSSSNPRLKPHEKRDLWQSTVSRTPEGRVFADRDGHPYCYLQLNSQVIPNREAVSSVDMNHLWIGEQFAHGPEPATSRLGLKFSFKKSIIPTANMFQIGLHMSGACKLDWRWNGCNDPSVEFCYGKTGEPKREWNLDLQYQPFNSDQRFDEIVTDDDTRKVDTGTEAVLYHFMLYRFYHAASNASILTTKNDYATKFFNATMQGLRKRNLDLLVSLPFEAPREHTADEGWADYNTVWATRKQDGVLAGIQQ